MVELSNGSDHFLQNCKGILHVGANSGQERDIYAQYGLPVVWFEALPNVFEELRANLDGYPNQIAIQALLTDRDDEIYNFRIANNFGASSSILKMKYHKDIWPEVFYIGQIELKSTSLATALASHRIQLSYYDALVMDTQGSELLVLQGAENLLESLRFVKTEAADFEPYENCATIASLSEFLHGRGFRLARKDKFADHPTLGAYYDLLFERIAPRTRPSSF